MRNTSVNPFGNYGNIVYGKRFIGHAEEIRAIHSVIEPMNPLIWLLLEYRASANRALPTTL